jgi:lipoprotein-releasing system permease protein
MAGTRDLLDRKARTANAAATAVPPFVATAEPAPRRTSTRPFAGFEWAVALRYLKPRRKDGFISFISILSLAGIALAVAALIIVMSVMNGFRHDLLARILGLQGHIVVQGDCVKLAKLVAATDRVRPVPAVDL